MQSAVQCPLFLLFHFIPDKFEEYDVLRASGNQCFVIDQYHLPQIHVSHAVCVNFGDILAIKIDILALPVKRINLVFFIIVKALIWEILSRTLHFELNWTMYDFIVISIKNEMIMSQSVIMKQVYEQV
jgi:hypothetical protein